MTNTQTSGFNVDARMLKVGAILTGAGLLAAMSGMSLASAAVAQAARTWAKQQEMSPTAAAAAKLQQAKHASLAGVQAWRSAGQSNVGGNSVTAKAK